MSNRASIMLSGQVLEACRAESKQYGLSISALIKQLLRERYALNTLDGLRKKSASISWTCGPCYVCNYLDMANCHKCGKPRAEVEQK